jgi:hypothetical protein
MMFFALWFLGSNRSGLPTFNSLLVSCRKDTFFTTENGFMGAGSMAIREGRALDRIAPQLTCAHGHEGRWGFLPRGCTCVCSRDDGWQILGAGLRAELE